MKRKKYDDYKGSKVDYHNERLERITKRCENHAKSEIVFTDHEVTIREGFMCDVYYFKDSNNNYHRYIERRINRRYFKIV